MFNITPNLQMMLSHRQRPLSHIDKKIQHNLNRTSYKFSAKQLNIKINNIEKITKKYYSNILHKKVQNNSFSRAIQQKKLFYKKIYNKNYGNDDVLGLHEYLNIRKEKNPIWTKEYSNSRLSSTTTYRKINLRTKSIQKSINDQDEFKNSEGSNEKNRDKKSISINNKIDKFSETNDQEFMKEYSNIVMTKGRPISVSFLMNKEKNIEKEKEKQIEIKPEEVMSDEIRLKNTYIFKFGYIKNILQKVLPNSDYIRSIVRTTFINKTKRLTKCFESYNKILLKLISDETCLESFYNFCEEIIGWQKIVLDEIRYLKKENTNLKNSKKKIELDLNVKNNKIKEINENIIRYDLIKVKKGKLFESKINQLKQDFIEDESKYVNTIYNLRKEIAQLIKILGKYKEEKMNVDELKNKIEELSIELADSKEIIFNNKYTQRSKDHLTNTYIDELNQKIIDFDKEKNKWKEENDELSEEIINLKAKVDRMNETIKRKDKIISDLEKQIKEKQNKIYLFNEENLKIPSNTKFVGQNKNNQFFE